MLLYEGKILVADLADRRVDVIDYDDELIEKTVGGIGLASSLLETYSEDQPVVISTGPLTGTLVPGGALAVLSAFGAQGQRLHAPLTQFIGFEAKLSGFDAVVLKGVSPQPVILWIHDGFAALEDASGLWGKDTWQTADSIKTLKGDQVVQVVSIGPAGERGLTGSQVIVNYWASADHDGLAGTLGHKRVKAIAWRGLGIIDAEEPDELFALSVDLSNEVAGARRSKGLIAAAVSAGIAAGPLAEWLEPYVHRHRSCYGCPAACATFAKIDEPANEMLPSGVAEPGMLLTEPHSLLRLHAAGFAATDAVSILREAARLGVDPLAAAEEAAARGAASGASAINSLREAVEGNHLPIVNYPASAASGASLLGYVLGVCPMLLATAPSLDQQRLLQAVALGAGMELESEHLLELAAGSTSGPLSLTW